ncbi:hypothetical protein [Thermosphaera sp.]
MVKVAIRSIDEIAKKWTDVTPGRAPYYEAGVKAPKKDWETETINAAQTYKAAIQATNIDRLFAGGVKKAGKEKWERKATTVGVARYGPGIAAASIDYREGFAPFQAEIAATDIPPKRPRGSSENYERVKRIGDALFKKRLALRAATVGVSTS